MIDALLALVESVFVDADAVARVVAQVNGTEPIPTPDSPLDDPFMNGDFAEGMVRPFARIFGGPEVPAAFLALFVFGVSYTVSDGLAMPSVLLILLGGFLIPLLPAQGQTVAYMLVLFGVGMALYSAWNGGGTRPR